VGEKYEKSVQRRNCKVGFFAMFLILFTDYIFKETPCNNCILIILCYVAMSQQGEKKVLASSNSRLPETELKTSLLALISPYKSLNSPGKKIQLPICMMWCKFNGYHSSTLDGKSLKCGKPGF